jgi:hypothetical protein
MKTPKKKDKKSGEGKKSKKKYKVRNWKEYNQSLVDRGKLFFWITQEAIDQWNETEKTGKRGRPEKFSRLAIQTAMTLPQVFHLPLRQAEGFINSNFLRMSIPLSSPDHSTLSIRGETLAVTIRVKEPGTEPLHVVVDSTGIKVYGEGEWKVRMHGWGKHRTWKKLHIGFDEKTKEILMGEVTGNEAHDSEMLETILDKIPEDKSQVSADGAYDKRKCYEAIAKHGAIAAIPPQKNAKIWKHGNTKAERLPRDENLRRIRKVGRKKWKIESNYHRRSISENGMFRVKTVFGDKVSARKFSGQRTQLLLRLRILNLMNTLGMPESYVVA